MIRIEAVTKSFRSGRGHIDALRDICISFGAGTFTAIIGKSGSGKTTLLNCIGGLEPPDTGRVFCFGTPLYSLGNRQLSLFLRRHIGFIFQRGNLLSYLTVGENIDFPLTLNQLSRRQRAHRISELLDRVGLSNAVDALPHELSGGETQRVAVARAIAHRPDIVLADEPTASLDTETGRDVVQLMAEMGRDQGCTLIMVTHDTEITKNSDRVVRLEDGRIQVGHIINEGP